MLPNPDVSSQGKKKAILPFLVTLSNIAKTRVKGFRFPKQTEQARETLADHLQTIQESKTREKPSRRSLQRARGKNMRRNRGKHREKRTLSC